MLDKSKLLDRVMVYDVEIQIEPKLVKGGWDNPEGMKFASCVVYDEKNDFFRFFLVKPGEVDVSGGGTYDEFEQCKALLSEATLLVGFNNVKFDDRVIWGNMKVDSPDIPRYDILLEYIRSRFGYDNVGDAEKRLGDRAIHDGTFSLDGLGKGTLDRQKSGHGAHAPVLWRAEEYSELLEYNLQDVRLTYDLFRFIIDNEYVVDMAHRVIQLLKVEDSVG